MAYFQFHKLAAVLDASLSIFQMMFDSSRTNNMGGVSSTNLIDQDKSCIYSTGLKSNLIEAKKKVIQRTTAEDIRSQEEVTAKLTITPTEVSDNGELRKRSINLVVCHTH